MTLIRFFSLMVDCNRTISIKGVELTQPNYPNMYESKMDCKQLIQFNNNETVTLTFVELNAVDPNVDWEPTMTCDQ